MSGAQLTQEHYPGPSQGYYRQDSPRSVELTTLPCMFSVSSLTRISLQDTPKKQVLGNTDSGPQVRESQPPGVKFCASS